MATHQQKQRFAFASRRMLLPLAVLLVIAFTTKAEKNKFSVSQLITRRDMIRQTLFAGSGTGRYLGRLINETGVIRTPSRIGKVL